MWDCHTEEVDHDKSTKVMAKSAVAAVINVPRTPARLNDGNVRSASQNTRTTKIWVPSLIFHIPLTYISMRRHTYGFPLPSTDISHLDLHRNKSEYASFGQCQICSRLVRARIGLIDRYCLEYGTIILSWPTLSTHEWKRNKHYTLRVWFRCWYQ